MNEQRMKYSVGAITLMAGFSLAAMVIWFGEVKTWLKPRHFYTFVFERAPNIEPQVPIRRAGMRIGEVTNVEYSDEFSLIGVTCAIDAKNPLREGDEPVLKRELLGDTYIDIETSPNKRGQKDRAIIPSGRTLEGRSPLDTGDIASVMKDLVPNANRALSSFDRLANSWTEFGTRANNLIRNNETMLNQTIQEVAESSQQIRQLLENANTTFDAKARDNLKQTITNMREISEGLRPAAQASRDVVLQFNETLESMQRLTDNLGRVTKPLADRGDQLADRVETTVKSLGTLLDDLQAMTAQIRRSDGTLQRFISDPTIYQNIATASERLISGMEQLEGVLEDARILSDKLARHPGELGIQGVFTRDKGLKTPPSDRATGRSSRNVPNE